MKLWKKIVLTCLAMIVLLVFPPTRGIVLFILPLGSGIDDLIVIVLIVIILLVMFYKTITVGILSLVLWVLSFTNIDDEIMQSISDIKKKFDQ